MLTVCQDRLVVCSVALIFDIDRLSEFHCAPMSALRCNIEININQTLQLLLSKYDKCKVKFLSIVFAVISLSMHDRRYLMLVMI